ncbi:hypothetical protein KFE98_09615 [bacterium SCSIO 12741]|nr:hypothetical protein KFE98_09615 [bacterium SCSIO 12741]
MTSRLLSLIFLISGVSLNAQVEVFTTASDVGLTMNNVGVIGNSFKGSFQLSGAPSCEYPKNSGIEHLFEGGIWVGANIKGSFAVSTAAYDNSKGYSTGAGGYEMTAEQTAVITERSSLFNSKKYSAEAISHQDFLADFTDKNVVVPGTQIKITDHNQPLGFDVHLESYNWNYAFSNFFVIMDYTFTNNGQDVLDSVYIGMFANAVIRNVNVTPAGSGGTAFYNKGGNGYNDSLHIGYCYDAAGDPGFTESYFGHKFLGAEDKNGYHHPSVDSAIKVNYNAWTWSNTSEPLLFSPATDDQKYKKLTQGLNWRNDWKEEYDTIPPKHQGVYLADKINDPGNRSDLVSIGPFRDVQPGDQVRISFAILCAKKNEDGKPNSENNAFQQQKLVSNAIWAQTAYYGEDKNGNGILDPGEDLNGNGKLDRYILPAPPNIPATRFVPGDNQMEIYWSDNAESSIDPISREKDFAGYRIYLSKLGFDVEKTINPIESMKEIAVYDLIGDKLFYETGFDDIKLAEPKTFEGDTNQYFYKYTITGLLNGWQYIASVSAFDRGDEEAKLESLESSPLANSKRVFMGTPPNKDLEENGPFVYPNPYYLEAGWEGFSQRQTTKKLMFANLPERCVIRIFNMAGDLIDEIDHDQNYDGSDTEWFTQFSDVETTEFSGGEHGWDLISSEGQNIARGLYLFSVKDLETNKVYKGKFTIIK